jgi:hypothetical protein
MLKEEMAIKRAVDRKYANNLSHLCAKTEPLGSDRWRALIERMLTYAHVCSRLLVYADVF